MAPRPGQRANPADAGRSAFARAVDAIGFAMVAATALAVVATVVLLPAYDRTAQLWARRDALAAHVEANDALLDFNDRRIEAVKDDPVLNQRLLMQQQNLRRPNEQPVTAAAPEPCPAAMMLAARADRLSPHRPDLHQMAVRVSRPRMRRGMLALAAILLVGGLLLFTPTVESKGRAS